MVGCEPDGYLSARVEPELIEDVADVGIHGPYRNVEFCRNIMVAESARNLFGNFAFAGAE